MPRRIILREAETGHYDFALDLYLLTMQPYLSELGVWDEQQQRTIFAAQWKSEDARIIAVDGDDAGWLQFVELASEIRLQKLYVSPGYQRCGIGSEVLGDLLAMWRPTGKRIVLRVLKNNPARRLYERLGFSIIAEDGVMFRMTC